MEQSVIPSSSEQTKNNYFDLGYSQSYLAPNEDFNLELNEVDNNL